MEVFFLGFLLVQICEIFSVGGLPIPDEVRRVFSALHIAFITSTSWVLFLNSIVSFQLLIDGTLLSVGLVAGSALIIFGGTLYIGLDTMYGWTDTFVPRHETEYRNIALFVLYQLFPLVCLVAFYVVESGVCLGLLAEKAPFSKSLLSNINNELTDPFDWHRLAVYLTLAALLFAIGKIFEYVISTHICQSTHGRINGTLFESFFTLAALVVLWVFWNMITDDDESPNESPYETIK